MRKGRAVNTHERNKVEAFFAQVDEDGVSNAENAKARHHVIRRVHSTPKDKSFEDASESAVDRNDGLPVGVVEVDGAFVGLGIHILNEDVYPLQSFEIYLRDCGLVGHLDLAGCADVVFVDLYRNRIASADVRDMPALRILGLQDNQIEWLDTNGLPSCQGIDVGMNRLESIDVTGDPELVELYVNGNRLSQLDTSCNPKLKYLRCQGNRLTTLDVTANPLLRHLYATENPLVRISAWAPGSDGTLPLGLTAGENGFVGLSFNPLYNAQWKETGEWEQSYHAYPLDGFVFEGWYDEAGTRLSGEQDWIDEYGASRRLQARFMPRN
jgi:hypothetical protein